MYQVFCDETGHGKIRGIGGLSGTKLNLRILNGTLKKILNQYNKLNVEWKDISGDSKNERVANEIIDSFLLSTRERNIRADILCWDTSDSRHGIPGVDDQKNLQFMYYKLLRWIKQVWGDIAPSWEFYPDQNSSVNWDFLIEVIENTNLLKREMETHSFFNFIESYRSIQVVNHRQLISHDEPLIQLIDLLSGIHRFSIEKGREYKSGILNNESNEHHPKLFELDSDEKKISKGVNSKIKILNSFYKKCSNFRLSISFNQESYFFSRNRNLPLNFWFYKAKSEFDKAPLKKTNRTISL